MVRHPPAGLSPTTDQRYRALLRVHLIPQLGDVGLQKLSVIQIQEVANHLLREGHWGYGPKRHLSPKTVRDAVGLLRQARKQAVEWNLVAHNPADRVKLPRAARRGPQIATEKQARMLLDGLRGSSAFVPASISYHTGMRLGEVLALSWDDVNLSERTLNVRRSYTMMDGDGEPLFKEPKTRAGRRTVEIGSTLVEMLRRHRVHQAELQLRASGTWRNRHNLVCTREDGRPLISRSVGTQFTRKTRELGLAVTFHGLRHTHVSMLIKAGVPVNVISARIGHASPSITQDLYAHLMPGMGREAVELFEEMLGQ